jgi:hypothetical protein
MIDMQRMQKSICHIAYLSIFLTIGCFSPSFGETSSPTPVYCHQGKCLYCNDKGCFVIPGETLLDTTYYNEAMPSSAEKLNQFTSHLPQNKVISKKVSTAIANHSPSGHTSLLIKGASPKKRKPAAINRPIKLAKPLTSIEATHYIPTLDIGQYALHQGPSRSANLIEGIIPLYQLAPNILSFADIRFYNPNGTPVEVNLDLGFRRLFHQDKVLIGLYAGYDRLRSQTHNYYSQINAGGEIWIKRFFVGGDVYIPIGTKVHKDNPLNKAYLFPTNTSYRYNIALEPGEERVLPGVDAEIGYDITSHLTFYTGGYYFNHSDAGAITGPKFRATYTFYRSTNRRLLNLFDRIRIEGLITHDSVRGTNWIAGLRFTFGLGRHSNPTQGVMRHMADPIRRDLNVVTEGFNDPAQFYMIDGRRARVDIISDTSRQTIDNAVDPLSSSESADIIGIRGDANTAGGLVLGDRDLIITGGRFDFIHNGHPYTIQDLGLNGNIEPNNSSFDGNVFEVQDAHGTQTMQLQYLSITGASDDEGIALQTNTGNGFGQIIIDHVTSNIPFNFSLAGTSNTTGQVKFIHNQLNITDASRLFSIGEFGAVRFITDDDTQLLTINSFSYNQINVTNRTTGSDASGLYVWADSATPVDFFNGMAHNTINVSDNTGISGDAYGFYQDNASFDSDLSYNTITASGNADDGYGWYIQGAATIEGAVRDNTFTASGNGNGYGWYISRATMIEGAIRDNTFTVSGNGNDGYGWYILGDMTIDAAVSGNTFTASDNTANGYGWYILGDTTIEGAVSGNTFTASDNTANGYGWYIIGDTTIEGAVSGNTFTASDNTANGYGWYIQEPATIKGAVRDNTFTVSGNMGDNFGVAINEDTGAVVDFQQAVTGNQFTTDGYGFNLETNSGTSDIYFQGNSDPGELSSSNHGASVNPNVDPSPGIHYGAVPK